MRIDAARKFIALPLLLLGLLLCAHARDAHAAQLAQLARAGLPGARAYFEQAVQLRSDDAEARAGLAIALVFSGKEADARYQVQRMDDAGAQGPAARLARGLLLGLAGNADSQYEFSRAEEEGADRALALLCRATAAERSNALERSQKLMADFAALVPEPERGDYARWLTGRLDLEARLEGSFAWVVTIGGSERGVFTFTRAGGQLSGFYVERGSSEQNPLENVRLEGQKLSFVLRRNLVFSRFVYSFSCDVSGDLDAIPIPKMSEKQSSSVYSGGLLVRRRVSAAGER